MTSHAVIEVSPNSRFTVSNTPEMAPGHCIICGAADSDRQYIDFGMSLDFYGVVYFCSECFAEASATIGYIPVKDVESLRVKMIEPASFEKLSEEFRGYRNAVRTILRDCRCTDGDLPDVLPVGDSSADEGESDSDDGDAPESELPRKSSGS